METFGSGLRKIYSLCNLANIDINYMDTDMDFTIEFSRVDRNNMPEGGILNGTINGTITELESEVLDFLRKNKNATILEVAENCERSIRTVNRVISSLKSKRLIERVGSNKTGCWKVV